MRAFGIEKWNAKEGKFEKARKMSARERELFEDSEETKRLDFHSFRRSYRQALADANVNAQTGMRLAGHASQAAHNRYLQNTRKMLEAPAEAMPQIEQHSVNASTGIRKRHTRVPLSLPMAHFPAQPLRLYLPEILG
jgi:hypothetical protein